MKFWEQLIDVAAGAALSRLNTKQHFRLGAAGLRKDGKIVVSHNGFPNVITWNSHAESRLCRKLTPESIVAVVRVLASGEFSMAKPCSSCITCMKRIGVKRVYYSIANSEFGVIDIG